MLGVTCSHKYYIKSVLDGLADLAQERPDQIKEYHEAISKMLILDLDPLIRIMQPLYPPIGRMAEKQVEIYRSLILMKHLKIPLNNWVEILSNNPVLCLISGFNPDNIPKTSSFYDLINRFFPLKETPVIRPVEFKPKDKLKKGEKLPPKNPGIVDKLVDFIFYDSKRFYRRLSHRPERFLQRVFARVSVDRSVELGIVPRDVSASGDGTCIETGASSYGKKVCKCIENGIFRCTCDRKYSDPNANWGWDSHNERFFYGHTGYFIATHNKVLKTDLPLYLRLVQANRHDSVSTIFALFEFRELYPNLRLDTFISDSASDNYATYDLLDFWRVNAVIALNEKNKGNYTYPPALRIDENGVPICPANRPMVYRRECPGRCRIKWRCSRVTKGAPFCDACSNCSSSAYGRVIYTKPDWDLRLFTQIPRGSVEWKEKMKLRTASERVNDRILNDYKIEGAPTRGKKRIFFNIMLAAINMHLDAQLKFLTANNKFNLDELLHMELAA